MDIHQKYSDITRELLVGRYRTIGSIGIGLSLTFNLILDRIIYPELATQFLIIRALCCLLVGLGIVATMFKWGRQHVFFIMNVSCASFSVGFAIMAYLTNGTSSAYFSGVNLVLLGVCAINTFRYRQNILSCACQVLIYDGLSLLSPVPFDIHNFILGNFFMVSTGVLSVLMSMFSSEQHHDAFLKTEQLERSLVELKHSQSQLINAEKMASLGRIVSDISHEVNNPLMIISGNAQLSMMSDDLSEDHKKSFEIIMRECERAKTFTHRVLRFAKPGSGEVRGVDLGQSIDVVVGIVEKQFQLLHNIRIIKQYLEKPIHIQVDEHQMHEVFMNLLNNAREAMPSGGLITVTASVKDGRVRIDFTDTGEGMSPETLARVMEPFFSTKKTGIGIGLAVCYGILKAHNGDLTFVSEPGKGTTATIILPA